MKSNDSSVLAAKLWQCTELIRVLGGALLPCFPVAGAELRASSAQVSVHPATRPHPTRRTCPAGQAERKWLILPRLRVRHSPRPARAQGRFPTGENLFDPVEAGRPMASTSHGYGVHCQLCFMLSLRKGHRAWPAGFRAVRNPSGAMAAAPSPYPLWRKQWRGASCRHATIPRGQQRCAPDSSCGARRK